MTTTTDTLARLEAWANRLDRAAVLRRWCEQMGADACAAWNRWDAAEVGAKQQQAFDDLCHYLPSALLHRKTDEHYLTLYTRFNGDVVRMVVTIEPPKVPHYQPVMVWVPAEQEYRVYPH